MKRSRRRTWWPALDLEPFPDLGLTGEDLLADLDEGFAAWIGQDRSSETASLSPPVAVAREAA